MKLLPMLDQATDEACCTPSGVPALGAEEAKQKALVFKALADPNRLRLLSIVKADASGESCVCDLTEPLDLGQPTVSHHLKILVEAGCCTAKSAEPGPTTPWCPGPWKRRPDSWPHCDHAGTVRRHDPSHARRRLAGRAADLRRRNRHRTRHLRIGGARLGTVQHLETAPPPPRRRNSRPRDPRLGCRLPRFRPPRLRRRGGTLRLCRSRSPRARLGAKLLRALAESTERDGIWTIQASVFPENEASLKLHLANGYVVVGRRQRIAKMAHGPLTGQWRDTVLIERRSPAI